MTLVLTQNKKRKVSLEIKRVPISLNKWHAMFWADKMRAKEPWVSELRILWIQDGKPRLKPPVTVNVTYHFKDSKKRDYDNYTPKFILDGLKDAYLEDDNANEWITQLNLKMLFSQPQEKTAIEILET